MIPFVGGTGLGMRFIGAIEDNYHWVGGVPTITVMVKKDAIF